MQPRFQPTIRRTSAILDHLPVDQDIGLDLEWDKQGRISIYGFSWNAGQEATAFGRSEQADQRVQCYLERLGRSDSGSLVGHNIIAADLPKLREEGLLLSGIPPGEFDTMLALHCTHGHLAGTGSYDLRSLVLLCGQQGRDPRQWFPLDFKRYDEDIWETCAMDAAGSLFAAVHLRRNIMENALEGPARIVHKIAPLFAEMAQQGVRTDRTILEQIHRERQLEAEKLRATFPPWETYVSDLEEKDSDATAQPVNWRSPKILEYFKNRFGVPLKDRSRATFTKVAGGSYAGRTVPREARELAEKFVRLSQMGSDTFWIGQAEDTEDGLTWSKVDKDGFIYPEYNVVGSPDRPTCSGVNIQNFPRPAEDPRPVALRAAIVPPHPDMVLLAADFTNAEGYTTAIEAGDWDMIKAIQSKELSHERTAAYINGQFGLSLTRQDGKACNHARDKGESAGNLAMRLFGNRSRQAVSRAQSIIDSLLNPFPQTKAFRAQLWKACAENNPYIAVNRFGRRLKCFGRSKYDVEDSPWLRGEKRRQQQIRERWKSALAFLGRSTAVDALLRVMAKVYYQGRLDGYSLPYIEIHDELVYAVPIDRAGVYAGRLQEAFTETIDELGISIPCEVKQGENWAQCK